MTANLPVLSVVVGVGANLGDRLATMRAAVAKVHTEVARVVRASRVWETSAVGPPQPDYLNGAVLVAWPRERDLHALLEGLLAVEASLGRVRGDERFGPRTIDLDVLWADAGVTVADPPRLVVPHPRLAERAFAVLPLLDVAPHAPFGVPPFDAREVRLTTNELRAPASTAHGA